MSEIVIISNLFKNMRLFFLAFLICFFCSANSFSQEAIVVSGGNAYGQAGSVSYSVGQVAYTTHYSTQVSIAQGVQHAYDINVIVPSQNKTCFSEITIYPNPTKDYLTLEVANFDKQDLTYHLYDFNGRYIKRKKIIQPKTIINMTTYVRGAYFIYIEKEQKILKTFKIIKN